MFDYDYLVYIGKFSPFHLGHLSVVEEGLEKSNHLIMVVGSVNFVSNVKIPFTFEERVDMIKSSLSESEINRIIFVPMCDYYDDAKWEEVLETKIKNAVLKHGNNNGTILHGYSDFKLGLIGHIKDESSYYLKMLERNLNLEFVPTENYKGIHATDIRNLLFSARVVPFHAVSKGVEDYLHTFMETDRFESLCIDYSHIKSYKESWKHSPFPPQFMTTDSVVLSEDNELLLIKRKSEYGNEKYALPGGFLEENLTFEQNHWKELEEETNLDKNDFYSENFLMNPFLIDAPWRGLRGRTVTKVFSIIVKNSSKQKAIAGDDAGSLEWISKENYAKMSLTEMFDDHHMIINRVLGWRLEKEVDLERQFVNKKDTGYARVSTYGNLEKIYKWEID